MIELAFTICSIVEGAKCREQSLVFSDVSLITCMVGAQPQLAMWAEQHPNWTISKWHCRPAGLYAKA
jgi:hypothetical protein